jgi:hypothetical protein
VTSDKPSAWAIERDIMTYAKAQGWCGIYGDGWTPSVAGTWFWDTSVQSATEYIKAEEGQ